MDLRKPGEEEDEYSEMAEEALDPDNCFPDGQHAHRHATHTPAAILATQWVLHRLAR